MPHVRNIADVLRCGDVANVRHFLPTPPQQTALRRPSPARRHSTATVPATADAEDMPASSDRAVTAADPTVLTPPPATPSTPAPRPSPSPVAGLTTHDVATSEIAHRLVPGRGPLLRAADPTDHRTGRLLERAWRSGRLVRLARRTYVSAQLWCSVPAWDRHSIAAAAFSLARPGPVVFTGLTGAHLCGLPVAVLPPTLQWRATTRGHRGRQPLTAQAVCAGLDHAVEVPSVPDQQARWGLPTLTGGTASTSNTKLDCRTGRGGAVDRGVPGAGPRGRDAQPGPRARCPPPVSTGRAAPGRDRGAPSGTPAAVGERGARSCARRRCPRTATSGGGVRGSPVGVGGRVALARAARGARVRPADGPAACGTGRAGAAGRTRRLLVGTRTACGRVRRDRQVRPRPARGATTPPGAEASAGRKSARWRCSE